MTRKVVVGIFIGVLVALLVYSILGLVKRHNEEPARQRELSRKLRLETMQPKDFPSRCGRLVSDETHDTGDLHYRIVVVEGKTWDGKKEILTANFGGFAQHGEAPRWFLQNIGGHFLQTDNDFSVLETLYPCTVKDSL